MGTCSDNLDGAGNQQERLSEFQGWIVGFVDGEGCFSIGFVRQPTRPGRVGYKTGYQVIHSFVVTQGASSAAALEELKKFFGVGHIYRTGGTTITARISCSIALAGGTTCSK